MAKENLGPIRLNPRNEFDFAAEYRYLDLVYFEGSSYVCINEDTIDGVACIGIPPVGAEMSKSYWQLHGGKGEPGPKADKYDSFIILDKDREPVWDYELSDKIIIPQDMEFEQLPLEIRNTYDGCCGMIITRNTDIILPENSDYALDFDYINIAAKQYYMYTFVCRQPEGSYPAFIWNRTVIQGEIIEE